jgi:hypothetical protein
MPQCVPVEGVSRVESGETTKPLNPKEDAHLPYTVTRSVMGRMSSRRKRPQRVTVIGGDQDGPPWRSDRRALRKRSPERGKGKRLRLLPDANPRPHGGMQDGGMRGHIYTSLSHI